MNETELEQQKFKRMLKTALREMIDDDELSFELDVVKNSTIIKGTTEITLHVKFDEKTVLTSTIFV